MTDPRKAGALMLQNLQSFNEAALLMEGPLSEEVLRELDKFMEVWCKKTGWDGNFDTLEVEDTWVGPHSWYAGNRDEYWAWFQFEWRDYDASDSYIVADLCGCGQTEMGFRFQVDHALFGGKSAWNTFCKSLPGDIGDLGKLSELGFVGEEKGVWFFPVKVDSKVLADAYENEDYTEAFAPMKDALETLERAQPIFDQLLAQARKKCKRD